MNRQTVVWVVLLSVTLLCAPPAPAESPVSLVIAPPPVGYPLFSAGSIRRAVGVSAIYFDTRTTAGGVRLLGMMPYGSYQQDLSDWSGLHGTLGGAFLLADQAQMYMVHLPLQVLVVAQPLSREAWSVELFAGAGGSIGLTSMVVEIPRLVNTTVVVDPTTVETTTTMGVVNGGGQLTLRSAFAWFTLFGVASYSAGRYDYRQTSAMSFQYPAGSGRIPGATALTIGLDVLLPRLNVALSSLVQRNAEQTMVVAGVRRSF